MWPDGIHSLYLSVDRVAVVGITRELPPKDGWRQYSQAGWRVQLTLSKVFDGPVPEWVRDALKEIQGTGVVEVSLLEKPAVTEDKPDAS